MTEHRHAELVDGCFRCDLNRDEIERSKQWDTLERVIADAIAKCRHAEDYAIDAAEAVLNFAESREGRDAFAGIMRLEWVEGTVDTRKANPYFPRGKHNGILWHARRLVGKWEEIPYCRTCSDYHSGACEASRG